MNRRDLFRLAGAVAVAPRAMLAAPVVPVLRAPVGLAAWMTPTAEQEAFFGVDRTVKPTGLDSGIALREWNDIVNHRSTMARLHLAAQLQGLGMLAAFKRIGDG